MDQLRTEINGWFAELASTIEFVPRAGVIGRDSKPSHSRESSTRVRFYHDSREAPDYLLGAPIAGGGSWQGPILDLSNEREVVYAENAPAIIADGIILLMFLDRSLAKEAEQQATGDQIFSKKGSSSKTL